MHIPFRIHWSVFLRAIPSDARESAQKKEIKLAEAFSPA